MIAVIPGSFDPVTCGHFDIIERSASCFERVIVLVAVNSNKENTFTVEQRMGMLQAAIAAAGISNATVDSFSDGLLVDYVEQAGARVIIKGLRAVSDFEYEFQMALLNRHLRPKIETVFMTTRAEFSFLSSSIVREIARLGGEIGGLVPDAVIPILHAGLANSAGRGSTL
jgi:pantetheine-phosphate adenylyltransferase